MNLIHTYILNVLAGLDIFISALLGGDKETLSSRLGKSQRGDFGAAWLYTLWLPTQIVDTIAFLFGDEDHCHKYIQDGANVGRDEMLFHGIVGLLVCWYCYAMLIWWVVAAWA